MAQRFAFFLTVLLLAALAGCTNDPRYFRQLLETNTRVIRTPNGDSVARYARAIFWPEDASSSVKDIRVTLNGVDVPYVARAGWFQLDSIPSGAARDWRVFGALQDGSSQEYIIQPTVPITECSLSAGDVISATDPNFYITYAPDSVKWDSVHRSSVSSLGFNIYASMAVHPDAMIPFYADFEWTADDNGFAWYFSEVCQRDAIQPGPKTVIFSRYTYHVVADVYDAAEIEIPITLVR